MYLQVCSIEMVLGSTDAKNVVLLAEELLLQQQTDMNLFVIKEYDLVNMSHPEEGVKMEIKLKRKIMSEMMTTYLPSILLMMITFATTFFKPLLIEAALGVNLTTMLVMTNIFISKMESLPPTSDIKMIDIWLIFCQLVPFAQVVLLTAIEYLREEKELDSEVEKKSKLPERVSVKQDKQVEKEEMRAEDKPKPSEAWVPMNTEPIQTDIMKNLLIIGRSIL